MVDIALGAFFHFYTHSSECREYITYIEYPYRCNSCHESYVGRIVDYYWDGNTNQSAVNYYDNYNVCVLLLECK